ncbi:juvenile hormone epoxide hydrolase-like [Anticarsia gemmatalis]|uniref:juvenile hormone epoxide hydrolase-like n=1 Tax=Anticarsia gemmatalis TaxID=129554 RepID=UPI003F773FA7
MNSLINKFVVYAFVVGVVVSLTIEERDKANWGGDNASSDTSITNFTIEFGEEVIKDLQYRIKNRRKLPSPLKDSGSSYGFNSEQLPGWMDYWANTYNFTERAQYLNQYTHYKTYVQGLGIHFLKVKPKVTSDVEVVPLLLLHGFPGSIREFYDAIPLLTAVSSDRNFALEVIAPSIPGFGFSDATTTMGLGATEIATVFKNLMKQLGYNQFYVQGGDWGSFIGSMIATLYPDIVLGYHTNFAVSFSPLSLATWFSGAYTPSLVADAAVQHRLYPLLTILPFVVGETGYFHIQSTKPDTLGPAMESPTGLLAYIFQLFFSQRENLDKTQAGLDVFTKEQLLDNLMIYWTTNSFTTAARLYAETFNKRNLQEGIWALPTPVPTWTAHTRYELLYMSPAMLKSKFTNLINSTIFDDYGHFFALEKPDVYADQVLNAISAFRDFHAKSDTCKLVH